jgi:hypothetical protein
MPAETPPPIAPAQLLAQVEDHALKAQQLLERAAARFELEDTEQAQAFAYVTRERARIFAELFFAVRQLLDAERARYRHRPELKVEREQLDREAPDGTVRRRAIDPAVQCTLTRGHLGACGPSYAGARGGVFGDECGSHLGGRS